MGVVVRCPSMATHIRTSKCRILSFSVVLSDYSGESWSKKGKYEYCCHYGCIYFAINSSPWWDLFPLGATFIEHMRRNNVVCGRVERWIVPEVIKIAATKQVAVLIFALYWPQPSRKPFQRRQTAIIQRSPQTISRLRASMATQKLYTSIQRCRKMSTLDAGVHVWVV